MFLPSDRVAYTILGFGQVKATVLYIQRDGNVVVWPDRWGPRHPQSTAGEALSPLILRRLV